MPDITLEEIVQKFQESVEFFSGIYPATNRCGTTDVLGHSIGYTSVWFGSASKATEIAQSRASSEAFKNCFSRCGQLTCPAGESCVFDTVANQGFADRCRYQSIYLGIQKFFSSNGM